MIAVNGISKSFAGRKVVSRISFEVNEGQTMVLLGTSGSGKTTVLRMINRLLEADEGSVQVNGIDITAIDPVELRRKIGYVLQGYGLFPHYTVAENIAIVPKLLKWPSHRIRVRVEELMTKLRLPPVQYYDAYPAELSGGQKQRVGIARALAAEPPVLLLDEPFGALDPITRKEVAGLFSELDELKNKTIVLVTHDVQEAFEMADMICLLEEGKLVQAGTPAGLILHPANEDVAAFFNKGGLSLRLQALTLRSVWDRLQVADYKAAGTMSIDQNLWEALQQLFVREEPLYVTDRLLQQTRQISFEQIRELSKLS